MFCADYVAAFVYHALFTIGSVNLVGKEVGGDDDDNDDYDDNDDTGEDNDHDLDEDRDNGDTGEHENHEDLKIDKK